MPFDIVINQKDWFIAVDKNKKVSRPVEGATEEDAKNNWIAHMRRIDRLASEQELRQYLRANVRFYDIADPISDAADHPV